MRAQAPVDQGGVGQRDAAAESTEHRKAAIGRCANVARAEPAGADRPTDKAVADRLAKADTVRGLGHDNRGAKSSCRAACRANRRPYAAVSAGRIHRQQGITEGKDIRPCQQICRSLAGQQSRWPDQRIAANTASAV